MATLNCRGLKRLSNHNDRQFGRILRNLKYDILALQETHIDSDDLGDITQTILQAHSSAWTPYCGVISLNPAFTIHMITKALEGRLLCVKVSHCQQLCDDLLLYIIYAPATALDRPRFYQQLYDFMHTQPTQRSILLGDFNYNIHLRAPNTFPITWSNWLTSMWHDPFHNDEQTRGAATFHRGNTTIDFILCSNDLETKIHHPTISYVSHTDHNALAITMTTGIPMTGPGIWRLNPQLLRNDYVREEIQTWLDVATLHLPDTTPCHQWDWLKSHLKAFCQVLSRKVASHRNRQLQYLQREYRQCLHANALYESISTQTRLQQIRASMDQIQEADADILALRAGNRWREKGERSNAYFFNCLKERQTKQYIHALSNDDGTLCTSPGDMAQCAHDFYSRLYQAEDIDQESLHETLSAIPPESCLDDHDRACLMEPWTDEEITKGLTRSPYNSSPGVDGFPYELLRFIYTHDRTSSLMKQVFKDALCMQRTPESWRKSVVVLLPKKGDRTSLRNWRPISLICTDAKVFTRMLTARVASLMDKMINRYQTGFLHDRFIGDNGLLARLTMSLAQQYKIPGAALLLDQEKAYDRVHPQYLQAVLHKFGFPAPCIESISHLFFNTQLSININGYLSKPCHQQRGLRQGDPLSPLLFNLALEPFLRSLLSSSQLRGFDFAIPNSPLASSHLGSIPPTLKTLAYADDVLIFVSDPAEIQHIMTIIDHYCKASNAKLNHQKSMVVALNGRVSPEWRQGFSDQGIHQWHDRSTADAAIYLGFPLTSTRSQLETFLQLQLDKLRKYADILSQRRLSIRGKALVANALLLSRIWYCLRIIPLTQQYLGSIQSIIGRFLQGTTIPKVSFDICTRPKKEGGLGILHPTHHLLSLQLRWILPLLSQHHADSKSLAIPYLRFCIQNFCNTLSPVVPILFPERRVTLLSTFGHFKTLFQACDKLQLQVNWQQVTHHTVLDFPLIRTCTFAGPAAEAPTPTWRYHLVRDAFILSTRVCILRARNPRERSQHTYHVARYHRATARDGNWRIKPFMKHLLDSLPPNPIPLDIQSDYYRLIVPTTKSGLDIDSFKRKDFRYSLLPALTALPSSYPRESKGAWHRFWNLAIPHKATTVLWRLIQHRLSSRERLHRIIPSTCQTNACLICESSPDQTATHIETDQHFLFSCPSVKQVWSIIAARFFDTPSALQWDHVSTLTLRPPKTLSHTKVHGSIVIACGVLAIWNAHWRFIFDNQSFNSQAIANTAIHHILRIEQEHQIA